MKIKNYSDCQSLNKFDFKFALFYQLKKEVPEAQEFVDRCLITFDKRTRELFKILTSPNEIKESVIQKSKVLKRKDKKLLFKIRDVVSRKKENHQKDIKVLKRYFSLKEKGKIPAIDLNNLLNRSQLINNEVFKILLKISIGLDSNLLSYIKGEISDFIKKENIRLVFYDRFGLDVKTSKELIKKLLSNSIERLDERIEDKLLLKIFKTKLSFIFNDPEILELIGESQSSWSLADTRRILNYNIYGKIFLGFWVDLIEGRVTQNEINNLFEKYLKTNFNGYISLGEMWSFQTYFPVSEVYRKAILENMKKLNQSYYQKFTLMRLLNNEVIRQVLNRDKILTEYNKPLFNLQKSLYQDMIEDGVNVEFAGLELVRLGFYDEKILFWELFN